MFGLDTTDYFWITLVPFVSVGLLSAFAQDVTKNAGGISIFMRLIFLIMFFCSALAFLNAYGWAFGVESIGTYSSGEQGMAFCETGDSCSFWEFILPYWPYFVMVVMAAMGLISLVTVITGVAHDPDDSDLEARNQEVNHEPKTSYAKFDPNKPLKFDPKVFSKKTLQVVLEDYFSRDIKPGRFFNFFLHENSNVGLWVSDQLSGGFFSKKKVFGASLCYPDWQGSTPVLLEPELHEKIISLGWEFSTKNPCGYRRRWPIEDFKTDDVAMFLYNSLKLFGVPANKINIYYFDETSR